VPLSDARQRQPLYQRDKLNLDMFSLKDASQEDPDTLPPPEEIAAEIAESLEAALAASRPAFRRPTPPPSPGPAPDTPAPAHLPAHQPSLLLSLWRR